MLTGLIFDDRGNPMTPSHANKKGVRYQYYVSHALLQGRKTPPDPLPAYPRQTLKLWSSMLLANSALLTWRSLITT